MKKYTLTKSELKELLSDAFNAGFESAWTEVDYNLNKLANLAKLPGKDEAVRWVIKDHGLDSKR